MPPITFSPLPTLSPTTTYTPADIETIAKVLYVKATSPESSPAQIIAKQIISRALATVDSSIKNGAAACTIQEHIDHATRTLNAALDCQKVVAHPLHPVGYNPLSRERHASAYLVGGLIEILRAVGIDTETAMRAIAMYERSTGGDMKQILVQTFLRMKQKRENVQLFRELFPKVEEDGRGGVAITLSPEHAKVLGQDVPGKEGDFAGRKGDTGTAGNEDVGDKEEGTEGSVGKTALEEINQPEAAVEGEADSIWMRQQVYSTLLQILKYQKGAEDAGFAAGTNEVAQKGSVYDRKHGKGL